MKNTTPDEIQGRRGDSYSNQCRVTKACAIACRNERTIKVRACKTGRETHVRFAGLFPRRSASVHCSWRCCFCVAPGGFERQQLCVYTGAPHRPSDLRTRAAPESGAFTERGLTDNKALGPAPAGESGATCSRTLKCTPLTATLAATPEIAYRKLDNALQFLSRN